MSSLKDVSLKDDSLKDDSLKDVSLKDVVVPCLTVSFLETRLVEWINQKQSKLQMVMVTALLCIKSGTWCLSHFKLANRFSFD